MRKAILPACLAIMIASISAQSERFVLAIVRFDGRLVPFAAYNGGQWDRAWPEADEQPAGTPTLDTIASVWRRAGQEVPLVWRVMTGWNSATAARIGGLARVNSHCSEQLALASDLPSHEWKETDRFGVATDSDLQLVPIELVDRANVLWQTAAQLITARFSALESAQARLERRDPVRERPTPPVEVKALYREAGSIQSPLQFLAERRYRESVYPPGSPECPVRTIVSGWLLPASSGRLTLTNAAVFLTDCEGVEVTDTNPLAAFKVGDRRFWIVQEYGYEREAYLIVEPTLPEIRTVLGAFGGAC